MSDKGFQMKKRNSNNTDWIDIYPKTKANLVEGLDQIQVSATLSHHENTITLSENSSIVIIGIPEYSLVNDLLMVYKNSVYMKKGVDYDVNQNIDEEFQIINLGPDDWEDGDIFDFLLIKGVSNVDVEALENKVNNAIPRVVSEENLPEDNIEPGQIAFVRL